MLHSMVPFSKYNINETNKWSNSSKFSLIITLYGNIIVLSFTMVTVKDANYKGSHDPRVTAYTAEGGTPVTSTVRGTRISQSGFTCKSVLIRPHDQPHPL